MDNEAASKFVKRATIRYARSGEEIVTIFLLWSSINQAPIEPDIILSVIRLVEMIVCKEIMVLLDMPKNRPIMVNYILSSADQCPQSVLDAAKEGKTFPGDHVLRAIEFYSTNDAAVMGKVGLA